MKQSTVLTHNTVKKAQKHEKNILAGKGEGVLLQ
jgi:hypothetical protein